MTIFYYSINMIVNVKCFCNAVQLDASELSFEMVLETMCAFLIPLSSMKLIMKYR